MNGLGFKPGEVAGQSVFDMFGHHPQIPEDIRRALAGEEFTSTVQVYAVTYEARYSPLRDEGGKVVGVIGVATDITERKEAEEALRESEERFRRLMENAADAFLVIEPEGGLVGVNQMACEQFGYTREELLTLPLQDIYTTFDETPVSEVYADLVSSGIPVTLDGTGRRKDGTTFPIEFR